jgi:dTDP-4-dehydrorhamnose reductase
MKIFITGGSGRLGTELVKVFPGSLHPSHKKLELKDKSAVFKYIAQHKPEAVIHLAAWTDVRGCEMNKLKAWENNVIATENLVEACRHYVKDCYFVHMSTACVFRGDKGDCVETDIPYPDNFYSLTKLLAEFIVKRLDNYLIIRSNFVSRERWRYERAFVDRFGTYLFADDLALAIKDGVECRLTGIVHITGKEKLSMFELARITTPNIKPMTLEDADLPLPRDMSLRSIRIAPYELRRKKQSP